MRQITPQKVFQKFEGAGVNRGGDAPKMGNLGLLVVVFVPHLPTFKQIWRSI